MRKSVSVAFFSLMSTLLIFGTVIMGGSELVLFSNYFAQERYDVLDEVVNVAQRTASHLVQEAALPEGEELEALNTKLELIGESAEVYLFFTDCDGNVVLASDPDDLAGDVVEASVLEKSAKAKENYHIFGTLDGVLTEKSYISVHEMRSESGECTGYLFLCSSGDRLVEFRKEFFSNFFLSACLMLLVASVLTKVMMHKLTDPIQKVTDAAQRFGGGDLSVRVEGVDGEGEVADLARTFNQMADNIQSNDNSRGQFMGNIAHELRTPMTTIKGFIDGILDGTIPPDMQNHYLQLVSEETGRLARLIQNMLDLSKLESGEYQVNARMFNIWETLTGVALSAEQRINDGMIEIEGLTMDEKALVYADPDLIHEARALRRLVYRHPPTNIQYQMAHFLAQGHYETHLRRYHYDSAQRWERLHAALQRYLPSCRALAGSEHANAFWLQTPAQINTQQLTWRAAHAGVLIEPGARHFLSAAPPDNYFRMGFHAINPDAIAQGVEVLRGQLEQMG